jgi:hypothetical protein
VLPLAADAAAHVEQIEADSATSASEVRAQAASKRQHVRAYFAEKRGMAAAFFTGSVRTLFGAVERRRLEVTGWLQTKAQAVQATVRGLVTQATRLGTSIAAAIRQGAAAVTAMVGGAVTGILGRIVGFARSVPIPDLPGIRGIRNLVLGAADRVTSAVGRAVNAVRTFVDMVVGSVLDGLLALMSRIGTTLVDIVGRVVSVVTRVIGYISGKLGALLARARAALLAAGAAVQGGLARTERGAIGEIDRAETRAIADIQGNREHGRQSIDHVMDFSYAGGDYPAENAAAGHMDVVASTSSKSEFEGAARAAMAATVHAVSHANRTAVRHLVETTSSMIGLVARSIVTWMGELWTRVHGAFGEVMAKVGEVVARVISSVGEAVGNVVNALTGLVGRVVAGLGSLVTATLGVLRAPIDRLTNVARSIYDGVRNLLGRIVSAIRSLFGGSRPTADTSSLTSQVDGFTPARLASEAQMRSPPAIAGGIMVGIGVLLGEAAAGVAAALGTILFWVAVVLIVLLLLYLLYRLIVYLASRTTAVPKVRAKPKVRTKRRRPRRRKKPLTWNPSLTYGVVTTSGGMPGTLDTTSPLGPSAPLHAHHVWPKYVGGPVAQPLMSIRDTVHLGFIHPTLHAAMAASASSMGFAILPNVRNVAFIAHLRTNVGDRTTFAAVLTGYYASLNAITDPTIPAPAYAMGIASSFPRI